MGAERRDTPSSKETKIVLRPGYKLQISLPSPANARLLVYPACRGCLRFFPPPPPPRPVLHSIPARLFRPRNFRKVRLANDETPLRDSLPRMEIAGNFIGNGFFPDSRLIEPALIREGAINVHFSSRSPSRQRSLDPSSSAREKIPREFDDFELERGGSRVKFREILR